MRVLITGVQGYVGTRLFEYLTCRGVECVGCDPGLFSDCRMTDCGDQRILFKDVRQIQAADLDSVDAIVHLAGISNDPFGALSAYEVYEPTRAYSKRLAELAALSGTRFLFASSCSVYGRQDISDGMCDESSLPRPQTPYSQNKLDIERDLFELADSGFAPVMLRFATAYGFSPRMRLDIVVNMLMGMALANRKIVLNSDGLAWRPHVHIDDMCQAIALTLTAVQPFEEPTVLNVGAEDCNLRIIDVARAIQLLVPGCEVSFLNPADAGQHELVRDRKIQDGSDSRTYRVSFDRIHQVFPDFRCVDFADGLASLYQSLLALGFNSRQLQDNRFYRLQRYEWLLEHGRLSGDALELITQMSD